jgi:hypothetical protein
MVSATRFALASLAVWRVTHLLAEEDGPADAVLRLRAGLGQGPLGKLMDCFMCVSLWVAAPASLAVTRRSRELPVAWLALSGAACLLERATNDQRRGDVSVTLEREHPPGDVLREGTWGAARGLVPIAGAGRTADR